MDPDPGGPKTCGSGSATLRRRRVPIDLCSHPRTGEQQEADVKGNLQRY